MWMTRCARPVPRSRVEATPLDDRTSLLHKIGGPPAEVAPDAAITLTREMGKILAEAQGDVANC